VSVGSLRGEGGVWVALFGGGAIRRYRPDGTLDAHIALPVSCPTSLAFAGDALTDLYVTSSRHRLTAEQRRAEPAAGSLLRLVPGVRGRLPHAFGDRHAARPRAPAVRELGEPRALQAIAVTVDDHGFRIGW
jgi:hypothetical protein